MKREERAVETERERDRQTNRDRENGGEAREGGKEAGRQAGRHRDVIYYMSPTVASSIHAVGYKKHH